MEKNQKKSLMTFLPGIILLGITFVSSHALALTSGWNKGNYTGYGLSSKTIAETIQNLMLWLLYILGMIAIIAFVISGIMYLTSGGDEKQTESAKRYMIGSIIGVVIALSGVIILTAVSNWLDGNALF
ncbi:MAG: TrbC/VirB2 family protein [Candidatus Moraniibacteriota bacterium]|nr:MAG: TrbC/VirB2 family protein [Candidatus Moranbacteria bacterium]